MLVGRRGLEPRTPDHLIKSQSPQSNISDLAPKLVRTIAGKSYNCGQIEDK